MTAQLRTPELVLLVDPTETTGRRLVLRAEVAASYVRAVGQRSGSLTLAGLQVSERTLARGGGRVKEGECILLLMAGFALAMIWA